MQWKGPGTAVGWEIGSRGGSEYGCEVPKSKKTSDAED